MPFFDPLILPSLVILASTKKEPCTPAKAPKINVIPKTDGVEYDYRQALSNIQSVQMSTPDPYGVHSASITQGFMQGQITAEQEITFDYHKIRGQDHCLYYNEINVKIEIDPKIVIAREIKRDRCMFPAVLDHEMKHVNADRAVVNRAARNMGNRIYKTIKDNGMTRIVQHDNAEKTMQDMANLVLEVIEDEYNAMQLDRHDVQSGIDTREEYDRVAALCPEFNKSKQNLYQRAYKSKLKSQSR